MGGIIMDGQHNMPDNRRCIKARLNRAEKKKERQETGEGGRAEVRIVFGRNGQNKGDRAEVRIVFGRNGQNKGGRADVQIAFGRNGRNKGGRADGRRKGGVWQ